MISVSLLICTSNTLAILISYSDHKKKSVSREDIPILIIARTLWFGLLIVFFSIINVSAQDIRQSGITSVVDSVQAFNKFRGLEKLYLQLDKTDYLSSDTIWLKAYLFDGADHTYSKKTGLIYIEIASDSNKVVKRVMIPLSTGISWGNIALNEKDFTEGTYTIRAFSNWMRNLGEDYIFKKQITVSNPEQQSWLVNAATTLSKSEEKDRISIDLKFRDLADAAIGLRNMRVRAMQGNRVLYRVDKETSLYGEMKIDFDLPEKTDPSSVILVAEDLRKDAANRKVSIPLTINRHENIDLQFMPEGGNLVAGLTSEVAFKAISETGKGTDVSGVILNSKLEVVTSFSSSHNGMGKFSFKPETGESYIARIDFKNGGTRQFPFPEVKSSGIVLKVLNSSTDHLELTIQCSSDLIVGRNFYNLLGQTNEVVRYGASVLLKQPVTKVIIAKQLFPTGIARLTLLSLTNIPVAERRVFIDRNEVLVISVNTDRASYINRDSVAMDIYVRDNKGNPVTGSFSLAVTDDTRTKQDSVELKNILSGIFLSSGVKGLVEKPGYYFSFSDSVKAQQNLDLLLMTQGWTSYNWTEVFGSKKPAKYPAESEFTVTGKVTNIFNKPVANTGLILFSKNPLILVDTLTGPAGKFRFTNLPLADSMVYVIQTRNRRGGSFNVGIEVDEFVPHSFTDRLPRVTPWFVNTDTTLLESTKSVIREKHRYDAPSGVNVLDEVIVVAKKIIKDSKNKNGSGNADFILDEKDMLTAEKQTLYQLLEKRFGYIRKQRTQMDPNTHLDTVKYIMMNMYVNLVIDGVDIREIGAHTDLYMDYLTAEDITGIEVMKTSKYGLSYDPYFITKLISKGPADMYLEITTRSGNGAFLKKTAGVYLYRPVAYSYPHEFYRPKYLLRETNPPLGDLRSTIHWEPNIITNAEGKAQTSFYTADQPGTYTVIIEGADMNGLIGFKRAKITVK